MNKEFDKAFRLLNDEQRQAVKQIDGPVLVIAGPGTGKTQLLSTRVAYILRNTDTPPSSILCLAFTNKAAVNMKERIALLAPREGARVNASTFHSFAAEIMNIYPDLFWNSARLSVAPESTQLDIIESIIRKLPLDNPLALKFAGQYTLLNDIQRCIQLSKEAGLTPSKLRAILQYNIAYINEIESSLIEILGSRLSSNRLDKLKSEISNLPSQKIDRYVYPLTSLYTVLNDSLDMAIKQDAMTGKTTNTSRWKNRWIQQIEGKKRIYRERSKNDWWLYLSDVYQHYRDELHRRGYYDYSDMLVEVLAQLENNPEMLADIQERFNFVMIDEFQDTNPAQMRLAYLVASHHAAENRPNILAVGDDDQSIFRFNGAELSNMTSFRRAFPNTKVIVLTKNYRSTQAILDTANKIIIQASNRMVDGDTALNKNLVAAKPPNEVGEIRAVLYPSRELQFSEMAREIKKSYQPNKTMAVLARSHASLIQMAGLLRQLKVPVRYEQQSNILDHEIVKQTFLISKLLLSIQNGDNATINSLIHRIIRWPVWGIDPKVLWNLALINSSSGKWLDSLLASTKNNLKDIGQWFLWLAGQADDQPLAVTIEQIIGLRPSQKFTSPIRSHYLRTTRDDSNAYFHGLSAIQLLRALAHEFSSTAEPTLVDLVRFVEVNNDNLKIIADESPFVSGPHGVQLMTVHKAKGLEFDSVYIVDATQDNWQPRKDRRNPPSNLPLQPVGDEIDDYIRLLYVAATRAKSSLRISSYAQDHAGKDIAISPIVLGAMTIQKLEKFNQKQLVTALEENLRWPSLSGGQEKEILRARLENYNLNVTHLLNFMDLSRGGPQYFKEKNLLNLPEVKPANLSYGTAMHAAMETAQHMVNAKKFNIRILKEVFKKSLESEQLPKIDFERYLLKGEGTLEKLFNSYKYQMPIGSLSEQKFRNVMVGRAKISGKLDRVDKQPNGVRIVDYKTGQPLSSFDTRGRSDAIKAYKHKLQLVFYALLLNNDSGVIEGQMVYLEAENENNLIKSYFPSKEDIERVTNLVKAVWPLIINYELPDVADYSKDMDGILKFEQELLK